MTARGMTRASASNILSSLRQTTQTSYTTYINRFINYLGHVNITEATEVTIINFLQTMYNQGLSYSSINCAYSAIKTYMELLGVNISTELLCRFRKGVFNSRPNFPKYDTIWDPQIVLDYVNSVDNQELCYITHKCVTLLALASCQRVSTLHSIKLKDVVVEETKLIMHITELQKQSRPSFHQNHVTMIRFHDPKLCVVQAVEDYIRATKSLRAESLDALFITHGRPHRNASKDTIARWIKEFIHKAGVPLHFSAHSTRAAATSSKFLAGIDINNILKCAGWSCASTFHKFYNKTM